MKEKYTSPELELLCFAPAQRLAADGEIDFDNLNGSGQTSGASGDPNDVIVPIKPVS